MTILPVLLRELRAELRGGRWRRQCNLSGWLTLLILTIVLASERWGGGPTLTMIMAVVPFSFIGAILLLTTGLSHSGNMLTAERKEGTLPLLLITRLSGHDIILGKLTAALVSQLVCLAVCLPMVAVPLAASGMRPLELGLLALAWLNVIFFGLAFGLFVAVLTTDGRTAGCFFLLFLPFIFFASPFGMFVRAGRFREIMTALQWLNPGEALAHVQSAANGFRPGAFWWSLASNHAVSWCLVVLAGFLLPRAVRWQSAGTARRPRSRWWWPWSWGAWRRSRVWRTRLLERNPFLWLASRETHWTVTVWFWLLAATLFLGCMVWATRNMTGLATVFVIGLGACWHLILLQVIAPCAGHRLVEDRQSGALEMLLSTPLSVEQIMRGQWLSLRRRFLPPLLLIMPAELALMTAGYVTHGFGGMIDPEDRGLWLFVWSATIVLLPFCMLALGWLGLRHALTARNTATAGGIAFAKVLAWPAFLMWGIGFVVRASDWPLVILAYILYLVWLSRKARRAVLAEMRLAATDRNGENAMQPARTKTRFRWSTLAILRRPAAS